MNLADAIRKAANKGLVDADSGVRAIEGPFTWPQEPTLKDTNSPTQIDQAPVAPEPINQAISGGNAVRLEIFLNGEQMAGMLKAIMAGQHSVLTLREAASYLRISPKTLEKLVEDGEIPAVEIDGRYRFPKSNLDDWLASAQAENEEEKDVA